MCLGERGEKSHHMNYLELEKLLMSGLRGLVRSSMPLATFWQWLIDYVILSPTVGMGCVLGMWSGTWNTFSLIKTMLQFSGFQIKNEANKQKSHDTLCKWDCSLKLTSFSAFNTPKPSPHYQQLPSVHVGGTPENSDLKPQPQWVLGPSTT